MESGKLVPSLRPQRQGYRIIDQARKLNPEISFRVGNTMALDIGDETLAGIVAFYAIVNIPEGSLLTVSGRAATAFLSYR